MAEEKTAKGDFVEIKFTGYTDGNVFDSNVEEDLKKVSPESKPEKTIVVIGQSMVVPGLDKALEGKELNKEYKISLTAKEGFGDRNRELVKTIPLSVFTKQKINPYPGLALMLDNNLARIITISGARVITDFNNPLAGKSVEYKFTITRKVTDLSEKAEAFFIYFFRFKPNFEAGDKVTIKGPQVLESIVNHYKQKFKEIVGAELEFKLENKKEESEEEKSEEKQKEISKSGPDNS